MRTFRIVVLAAIWVALWGQVSVANLAFGLVVAVAVTLAFPPLDGVNGNSIQPIAALRLGAAFALDLLRSTWSVVVAVLRPRLALEQAIVAVPLRTDDPVVTTVVANGISLTPGTLTVDLVPPTGGGRGGVLYVHVLTLVDRDEVIADAHRLEALAVAAFPPAEGGRVMTVVIAISFALIGLGAVTTLVRLLLGPTLADRVVATDLLLTLLMGAAAVESARTGEQVFLVVMVVVAVVGFLGTASVARYIETKGP